MRDTYQQKVERYGAPIMRHIERDVVLRTLDQHWREHLAAMEYLKQGIHLRGYAQKDYRFEFKREAFELFSAMLDRVKFDTRVHADQDRNTHPGADRSRGGRAARAADESVAGAARGSCSRCSAAGSWRSARRCPAQPPERAGERLRPAAAAEPAVAPFVRSDRKVGRNEPCPCGSGKKFKHCHGALAGTQ